MDVFSSQATAFASQHFFLAYLFAYGATIFLGNIGAFISLWLVFQGALGAWGIPGVLVAIFVANVTGDILWYSLGRGLRTTGFGAWIKRRFPNHGRFDDHIVTRGPRWMLFAKFAYGANFPIIFSLGWAQFPFRRFFRRSLLAIAIWLPVILGVSFGLYSSLSPLAALLTLKRLEVVFLIALVAFVVLQWVVARVLEKVFRKNGNHEA